MTPICGNCNKSATLKCVRCNIEYYCSKSCQMADFPQHRFVCFSLPSLKPIGDVISNTESALRNAEPHIAEVKCDDPKEIKKAEKPKPIDKTENPKQSKDSKQKNASDQDPVPAFDQGIRTSAPNDYKTVTSDVSSKQSPSSQIKKIEEEKSKKTTSETITNFNFDKTRRNQKTILLDQPLIKPKDGRILFADMKTRPLKIGKASVIVMNGDICSKVFHVNECLEHVEDYLGVIENTISELVERDKTVGYKPIKNEMVLAKFDGVYYRGVVRDIITSNDNTTYQIFFVDYGNSSDAKEDDLKPFHKTLKIEIILHEILLENIPSPKEITNDIIDLLQGKIDIDVKEKTDNYYIGRVLNI